jgi:hypothetical protein
MNRFVWQGGTLVSKAKVTINGVVYEVEPEEYEGQTPLSPENLMEMQEIIFQSIYPVGSIYMSTASTNPATLFGVGTWELWGKGKVPVGIDTEDTDFDVVEKTGGEKEHTLTIEEMPSHNHQSSNYFEGSGGTSGVWAVRSLADLTGYNDVSSQTGGNQPHNILQPYITCYMWKRTA